jgi:hypothetical protein
MIFVPTWLRDDIFNTALAKNKCSSVFRDIDLRAVADNPCRPIEVSSVPIIVLLEYARGDGYVFVKGSGGYYLFPLVGEDPPAESAIALKMPIQARPHNASDFILRAAFYKMSSLSCGNKKKLETSMGTFALLAQLAASSHRHTSVQQPAPCALLPLTGCAP